MKSSIGFTLKITRCRKMAIYKGVKYNTLPEQVNENKKKIKELEDRVEYLEAIIEANNLKLNP